MSSSSFTSMRGMLSALVLTSALDVQATTTGLEGRDDDVDIPDASTDCHDIHIFLARGNNEAIGTAARQATVVKAVCDGRDSCGWEDIYYDNPTDNEYAVAVYEGATNGQDQIRSYVEECSDAKLVLTGYSQGAHVVADMLSGGGDSFETLGGGEYMGENSTEGLIEGFDRDSSPGNQIVAAFLWGDTRHTADQSYNVLNGSSYNGWYPRNKTELANLDVWADIVLSWCHDLDRACATDADEHDDSFHLNYLSLSYPDDAADWLAVQLGEKKSINSNSSIIAVSSATTTSNSTSSTGTSSGASVSATSTSKKGDEESESSATSPRPFMSWLAVLGAMGLYLI